MKTLQLNFICKKEFNGIDEYTYEKKLLNFLRDRGYNYAKDDRRKLTEQGEFKKIVIDYSKIFDSNNCCLTVEIEISRNYPGEYYLQGDGETKGLIFIVEDFFKLNFERWFYVETLEAVEIELIENNRELNPISLINLLNEFEQISRPNLEILFEDEPSEQESNYYYANKIDFKNINDFWLSSRIITGELGAYSISGNYDWFKNKIKHYYDVFLLGKCIPQKEKYLNRCKFLESIDSDLNESKLINCYEMLDNTSVVFDFEDKYVILDKVY